MGSAGVVSSCGLTRAMLKPKRDSSERLRRFSLLPGVVNRSSLSRLDGARMVAGHAPPSSRQVADGRPYRRLLERAATRLAAP